MRSPCEPLWTCTRDVPAVSVKGNIFPLHRALRYPTRYTRRLDWGTPVPRLIVRVRGHKQRNASRLSLRSFSPVAKLPAKNPNRSSVSRTAANVRPPLWLSRPGTFSNSRYGGCRASASRASSKNRVPLGSSNPLRWPARLKAWQGNPPHSRSNSGMVFGSASLASLQYHSPLQSNSAR